MTVPIMEHISVTVDGSAPDITQLTTQNLQGTGIFDQLMNVVKMHLLDEYEHDRLSGADYTTVYVQAIDSVLKQSVAYLTNQQNEKLIGAQIGLTRQKIVTELANTDDDIPEGLGFNGTSAIEGLVKLKKDIDILSADLVTSQVATDKAKRDFTGQQIITELAATDTEVTQAIAAGYGFNDGNTVSGAMAGANQKSIAEAQYAEQKVVTELGNTSLTKPYDLGLALTTEIGGLVSEQVGLTLNQKDKAQAEVILISQKSITELAQTSDTLPVSTKALTTVATVQGSVARQQQLFEAQIKGFATSAEQKLTKMMLETWSVGATVGNATANTDNQLTDISIGQCVAKAKAGVGIP